MFSSYWDTLSRLNMRFCLVLLYFILSFWVVLILKGKWKGVDLGERGGGESSREKWKEGKLSSGCIYERRIYLQNNLKTLFLFPQNFKVLCFTLKLVFCFESIYFCVDTRAVGPGHPVGFPAAH